MHFLSFFILFTCWQPHALISRTAGAFLSNVQQPLAPREDDLIGADTVILGAGVIGLATAYQLALAQREASNAEEVQNVFSLLLRKQIVVSGTFKITAFGTNAGLSQLIVVP